jgi:hypothetical protein
VLREEDAEEEVKRGDKSSTKEAEIIAKGQIRKKTYLAREQQIEKTQKAKELERADFSTPKST